MSLISRTQYAWYFREMFACYRIGDEFFGVESLNRFLDVIFDEVENRPHPLPPKINQPYVTKLL